MPQVPPHFSVTEYSGNEYIHLARQTGEKCRFILSINVTGGSLISRRKKQGIAIQAEDMGMVCTIIAMGPGAVYYLNAKDLVHDANLLGQSLTYLDGQFF